jgi:hypothetical protein
MWGSEVTGLSCVVVGVSDRRLLDRIRRYMFRIRFRMYFGSEPAVLEPDVPLRGERALEALTLAPRLSHSVLPVPPFT